MRAVCLLLCALFLASDARSQTSTGVIAGVVSDPEGAPFANAFVQIKATTGSSTIVNEVSDRDGRYRVTVPSGTCELTVSVPGMKSYSQADLAVKAGATLRVDARLEDGPSLRTSYRNQEAGIRKQVWASLKASGSQDAGLDHGCILIPES